MQKRTGNPPQTGRRRKPRLPNFCVRYRKMVLNMRDLIYRAMGYQIADARELDRHAQDRLTETIETGRTALGLARKLNDADDTIRAAQHPDAD